MGVPCAIAQIHVQPQPIDGGLKNYGQKLLTARVILPYNINMWHTRSSPCWQPGTIIFALFEIIGPGRAFVAFLLLAAWFFLKLAYCLT